MANFALRLKFVIAWILKLGLIAAIPYSLFVHDYLFIFGAISAVIVSLLPAYWSRRFQVLLPWGLDLFISLALFLHIILGEIFRFYDNHWYFDKIMHFYGTGLIALIAFLIVFTFHWSRKITLSLPLIAYFTVIFSVAVGAFWEMGEFAIDQIFHRNTQYSLENTMWDLIFNFVGGGVAALFGILYIKRKNRHEIEGLVTPVKKILD